MACPRSGGLSLSHIYTLLVSLQKAVNINNRLEQSFRSSFATATRRRKGALVNLPCAIQHNAAVPDGCVVKRAYGRTAQIHDRLTGIDTVLSLRRGGESESRYDEKRAEVLIAYISQVCRECGIVTFACDGRTIQSPPVTIAQDGNERQCLVLSLAKQTQKKSLSTSFSFGILKGLKCGPGPRGQNATSAKAMANPPIHTYLPKYPDRLFTWSKILRIPDLICEPAFWT